MKIEKFNLNNLRNEEHFHFHSEVRELIAQETPEKLHIEKFMNNYNVLFEKERDTLEVISRSFLTAHLIEADENRDSILKGLYSFITAHTFHFDENIRTSAEKIQVVFKHYGNLTAKSYNEETASINNLIHDLRVDYQTDLVTLNINDWLNNLEVKNNEFNEIMQQRYSEHADKNKVSSREIRIEIDKVYTEIIDFINAWIIVNGEGDFSQFVKLVNERVQRNILILKIRKSRGNKNSDIDNPENTDDQ